MKILSACMMISLVVLAGMFHPLMLYATGFQNATVKLTVIADSPYNYEVKEVNLSNEQLNFETLLRAHTKEELQLSNNNEHRVIVTEQTLSHTANTGSCSATFKTKDGKIYSVATQKNTQKKTQNTLAKCHILTSDDGSLKIMVSHKHS